MLTDREAATAFRVRGNALAPARERQDANRQVTQHFFNPGAAAQFAAALPQGMEEGRGTLLTIAKAIGQHNRDQQDLGPSRRQSAVDDPFVQWTDVGGTIPRRASLPPAMLRDMGESDPILRSIVQILKNQAMRHLSHAERGIHTLLTGSEGYDIIPTFKAAHVPLTEREIAEKQGIIDFIQNCGDAPRFRTDGKPNREDLERSSLHQFTSAVLEDRFHLDAVAIELERTRSGRRLSGVYAVDGASIVRTDPFEWPLLNHPEAVQNPSARFAQILNRQIYTSYGSDDLFYDFVNARSVVGQSRYGFSETEMSYRLTTGILNILTTNNAAFDRNAIPPSLMVIRGMVNQGLLNEFAEEWNAYRLGAGGEYGLPMLNIRDPQGGLENVPIKGQPSDMVFSSYVSFLAAIRCAIFGLDVSELNHSAFGGSNSGLDSGKSADIRLESSRNKAFIPMMTRLEMILNTVFGPVMGNRWRLQFQGLVKQDPKQLWDVIRENVTVDEIRTTLLGMPPHPDAEVGGSLSKNPAIAQMKLAKAKAEVGVKKDTGVPDAPPAKTDK